MKTEKWVKFPNLKIEVKFEQEQNGILFEKIEIPKDCRMLRLKELGEVINYIIVNNLDIWSYFEQPIKRFEEKYTAGFFAFSDWVGLGCIRNPENSDSALGVIFCREMKK